MWVQFMLKCALPSGKYGIFEIEIFLTFRHKKIFIHTSSVTKMCFLFCSKINSYCKKRKKNLLQPLLASLVT